LLRSSEVGLYFIEFGSEYNNGLAAGRGEPASLATLNIAGLRARRQLFIIIIILTRA
jgi:hypothetical protein